MDWLELITEIPIFELLFVEGLVVVAAVERFVAGSRKK